jgi:hypothetical protein
MAATFSLGVAFSASLTTVFLVFHDDGVAGIHFAIATRTGTLTHFSSPFQHNFAFKTVFSSSSFILVNSESTGLTISKMAGFSVSSLLSLP